MRISRSLVLALAFALLVVQGLGLLHRVVHGGKSHAGGVGALASGIAIATATKATLPALFEFHREAGDCQLFDQLSHGDLTVGGTGHGAAGVVPGAAPRVHSTWHVAAQAQGFLARAPPSIS